MHSATGCSWPLFFWFTYPPPPPPSPFATRNQNGCNPSHGPRSFWSRQSKPWCWCSGALTAGSVWSLSLFIYLFLGLKESDSPTLHCCSCQLPYLWRAPLCPGPPPPAAVRPATGVSRRQGGASPPHTAGEDGRLKPAPVPSGAGSTTAVLAATQGHCMHSWFLKVSCHVYTHSLTHCTLCPPPPPHANGPPLSKEETWSPPEFFSPNRTQIAPFCLVS